MHLLLPFPTSVAQVSWTVPLLDLAPLRVEPLETGGCGLLLLWHGDTLRPSISQVLGPTLRGQDAQQVQKDKEDANRGVTMAMARAREPSEDAGRVGSLSFTFSSFPAKGE